MREEAVHERNADTCLPLAVPFDWMRLDSLMAEADLDALVVTSKHNIQYLLGGYRYFFYNFADACGLSRYQPCVVYVRGRPDEAAYIGSPMEAYEKDHGKFWVAHTHFDNMTVADYAGSAVRHLLGLGRRFRRVGVEMDFLPASAGRVMEAGLPGTVLVNANLTLELLRAVKTTAELAHLRSASEKVVNAMLAVFAAIGEGTSKHEIADLLRHEETLSGLHFDYALVNMGTMFDRVPSDQRWRPGEVLALDSGANEQGYIGDLCRMAVLGEPDHELQDLLGEVEAIQQAARRPIRAGARGGDIFAAPDAMVARSTHRAQLDFIAHGMGLIGHEAPWLTDRSSVPYAAYHADRPLEAGMVISIETTLVHPRRGFIKLEDTVAVTDRGWESFGDHGRGWNRGATGAADRTRIKTGTTP